MIFEDRTDAGRQLARRLSVFAERSDVVVLGVPRGGVAVAFEVALALHVALHVFLSRKLGVPAQPELAFGAVAAGGGRYIDAAMVRAMGISQEQVDRITAEVRLELDRRVALYRCGPGPLQVEGRMVILVDDGIATGASVFAAVEALREMRPARLVLAVPVAPPSTAVWLQSVVDELICLETPSAFFAVGAFYRDFAQVEDAEVIDLLQRAGNAAQEKERPRG